MFCLLLFSGLAATAILITWAMRSTIVGGGGILWWLVWPLMVGLGIAAGCTLMVFHTVPENQEDRPAIVTIEYGLSCLAFVTALLWVYSAILFYRFGIWPRSPESTSGFPIIVDGTAGKA